MSINPAVNFQHRHSLPSDVLWHELRQIASVDAFEALREAWHALADKADECPASLAFDYCELAASRVLAHGELVCVVMVYHHGELLALWPMSIARKGVLRIARSLTCGSGEEYGGPLVRTRADSAVYASMVAAIKQMRADVIEIPFVRNGSALQTALESVPQSWVHALLPPRWRGIPGYSISLREFPKWGDFERTLPRSLRDNLRKRHKRLEAQGHAEFGWCTNVTDAASVLTWLFDNKRRWAERRGFKTQYLMDTEVRDFFIALAHRMDLSTNPLVAYVKVNGVPVAAAVNLIGSRSVESLMTTYDEAFSRCSVGNLLTEFQVRWSHANGRDFDLRAFYSEYKAAWANCQARYQTRVIFLRARGRLVELPLLRDQAVRVKRRLFKEAAFLLERWRHRADEHVD